MGLAIYATDFKNLFIIIFLFRKNGGIGGKS